MELTGAGILAECLTREKVEAIFCYPGGVIIDLLDEMARHRDALTLFLTRHEQGAVHAADGYARASGKTGVCIVTSGPGATNAVTGIATAYCDSIPLVVITGQVPTSLIGNDAFQEVDIAGITRPCTKHNYVVKDVKSLVRIVREAFYLAKSGRPGPVLIDLPKDVTVGKGEFVWTDEVRLRSYNPNYKPNMVQLRRAAELITKSRRPLFLIGGGVIESEASAVITDIALRYRIPMISTLMGLGGFPGTNRLWHGMVGMHGTFTANRAVTEADVLIAVGTRFADRVTGKVSAFAKQARIIHIDIDPTSIRKNVNVDVPVVADCREAAICLAEILAAGAEEKDWEEAHSEWLARLAGYEAKHPLTYLPSEKEIKPQQVIELIDKLTREKRDVIVSTDVGQHQMWTAQFFKFTRPRAFLSSGGLGTMGYGLPAALGAQTAMPEKLVVCISGDGSVQMNIQELATIVANNLPVKVVILNNRFLGMVRQWQDLFFGRNYVCTDLEGLSPDFVKLAEAYGATGFRISEAAELAPTLQKALDTPGAVVVDVRVCREENVYPMVPAGKGLEEMIVI
ncbi:MAG: biosynthetic-type acetolactate synthase large subunit [Desulfovibrio sp.]|jgi:acetolactate synthase-1/2/3 large subunit|nr:biosynthetic-type acetolactate synthase large subunit [Desulfovibrio sp.]